MTSEVRDAFIWTWLAGASEPVPAGRVECFEGTVFFNYGRSYLERPDAVALSPELPLCRGRQRPPRGLRVAGALADAAPDAWGQRLLLAAGAPADTLGFLVGAPSNRVGALDVQADPLEFVPRTAGDVPLETLVDAAARFDRGELAGAELDVLIAAGAGVGGAHPKVVASVDGRERIVKLTPRFEVVPTVRGEAAAMLLAARVGLNAARVEVAECAGAPVLLVDRFDRTPGGGRRIVLSALTVLGLDARSSRFASYPALADAVRTSFVAPRATLRELFARIVFNVCVGNTDDHARNHAAFWDGDRLELTPVFDVCPQPRSGSPRQAMAFGPRGYAAASLRGCVASAPVYGLAVAEAQALVDAQVAEITDAWPAVADAVGLDAEGRARLWRRSILNPSIFEEL